MSKELVEGLKEFVRTSLIALIPNVIASIQAGEVDWKVLGMSLVIAVLRALDKWAHEEGVKTPLDLKGMDTLKA